MACLSFQRNLFSYATLLWLITLNTANAQLPWSSSAASLPSASKIEDLLHRLPSSEKPTCDTSSGECLLHDELPLDTKINRRVLDQQQYYISYGSLAADRVPCPPMSGRSYYTPNCNSAYGRPNPYQRGCSAITRCRRDYS